MPIAFLSPFTNSENAYIETQKALLRELGYSVQPLQARHLLRTLGVGLLRRENIVLLSWLENRAFRDGAGAKQLDLPGLAAVLSYAGLLAVARARVVYIVHNREVHDVARPYVRFSRTLIRLLSKVADLRVVHDPSSAAEFGAAYVPHALYEREWPAPSPFVRTGAELRFAIVGAIRPYKRIEQVLKVWPHGHRLLIAGRASAPYLRQLREIVARRGLGRWVTIAPGFLGEEAFARLLHEQDVVVLPHAGSNLVSGAFFEAVGHAGAILGRNTPFMEHVSELFPNVVRFDRDEEIPARVRHIVARWPELCRIDVRAVAERHFGRAACLQAYRTLLAATPRRSRVRAVSLALVNGRTAAQPARDTNGLEHQTVPARAAATSVGRRS